MPQTTTSTRNKRVRVTFPPSALRAHGVYRRTGAERSAHRIAPPPALVAMYRTCGAHRQFTELPDVLLAHIAEYATCCLSPVFNGPQAGTVVILG